MSAEGVQSAVSDAVQRAKDLAANHPSLKRTIEGDSECAAKRASMGDGASFQLAGAENVTEVISIPDNTVGLVIGRGGEQISSIQAQSGARVQMSPAGANGVRECTVQGPRSSVEHAKQLIKEVISRPPMSQQVGMGGVEGGNTVEILIPGNKCGLVIGKQGETIKMLQRQSGAKMMMIQDTHDATGAPKPLRISGTPQMVEHAKRLVTDLLEGKPDEAQGQNVQISNTGMSCRGEVVVPRSAVGLIIGKGGETIKRLGMQTGTRIQFKPDDDPSSSDRCAVITANSRDQIFQATTLITQLVYNKPQQEGNQFGDAFYLHVPASKTGLVIGKGGETIKQINAESGAHCELSRDIPANAAEKVFVIRGSPYQIHHAKHLIQIKVGDLAPGTPVPPFDGAGGCNPNAGMMNAQFSQPTQQWPEYCAPSWNAQQQNYYDPSAQYGGQPQMAMQQYAAPQQAAGQQQSATTVPVQQQQQPAAGQQDYSAQWAEYYRTLGMHEQAALIESQIQMKQGQVAAAQTGTNVSYTGAVQQRTY